MNHTKLRDFPAKTLQQVSGLIEKRVIKIRETRFVERTGHQHEELNNLLEFQTQVEHALQLVKDEQKLMSN